MSIPKHVRTNFTTLLRAAAAGDLALVECADAVTGAVRHVICAAGRDGDTMVMTPFGHLCLGNPYEAYRPPNCVGKGGRHRQTPSRARGKGGRDGFEPGGLQRERPTGLSHPSSPGRFS